MGFKQKLLEKKILLHMKFNFHNNSSDWLQNFAKRQTVAMRVVSPVGNEQYRLIEFKIKQVVI